MRVFRAEDGAELSEEDLLAAMELSKRASFATTPNHDAVLRVLAALAPKTCGAVLVNYDNTVVPYPQQFRCVLPPGHHPYAPYERKIEFCCICANKATDMSHSPGHMPAPECWREP